LLGLINSTVGTSAAAQLELITGTAFSYVNSRLNDNNGSPYYTLEGGSAVNNAYYHFNNHYWGNQAGTNFAALTSSGYFGVGLTGPNSVIQSQYASGLYTNAEGSVHGFQTQTGETTSDYTLYMGADKTHGVAYIQGVNWGVTYAPLVLNGRGGSVGIGTPSPAYTLDVSGSIRSSVNFIPGTVSNTGGGTWQFGSGAWSGNSPATTSVNSVTGITYSGGSGSQLFTLSSAPGNTSLQLDGSIFIGDGITYNPLTYSGSTTGGLVVQNGGSFGGSLYVNGSIYATSDITAYYSDERLKTNIEPIVDALGKIKALKGITYYPNQLASELSGDDSKVQRVGVIAQDVAAVLPQIVKAAPFDIGPDGTSKSGENYLTVQYDKLTALLIEAVKELGAKVERLQGEIDQLKG